MTTILSLSCHTLSGDHELAPAQESVYTLYIYALEVWQHTKASMLAGLSKLFGSSFKRETTLINYWSHVSQGAD